MAFFLRRAFKVGPVRFNLSKSGFGISAGVTGARLGITSRGKPYVAGGRHGMYYRKNIGSRRRQGEAADNLDEGEAAMTLDASGGESTSAAFWTMGKALGGIALFFGFLVLFAAQPPLALAILLLLSLVGGWKLWRNSQIKRRISDYKARIEAHLVQSQDPPTPMELDQLKALRAMLDGGAAQRKKRIAVETAAYHALMERITEGEEVTAAEAEILKAVESLFALPESETTIIKRDVFVETYLNCIADQVIKADELQTLENYVARMRIPEYVVQPEIDTVNEMLRAQRVSWPLKPLAREALDVNLLQSETAYYTCDAKVLWKKRDRSKPGGYRYDLWRDGSLVMTERRFFVVGGGSTEVRYSEVGDIEVDLDTQLICVTKTTSNRPVYLDLTEPIYVGAILNVLNEAWRRGDTT